MLSRATITRSLTLFALLYVLLAAPSSQAQTLLSINQSAVRTAQGVHYNIVGIGGPRALTIFFEITSAAAGTSFSNPRGLSGTSCYLNTPQRMTCILFPATNPATISGAIDLQGPNCSYVTTSATLWDDDIASLQSEPLTLRLRSGNPICVDRPLRYS